MQDTLNTHRKARIGFILSLFMALGFALFCFSSFKTVVVSGESMLPTFKDRTRLLVSNAYWLVGPIKPKDIVVVKNSKSGEYIIKRVYKMGGQKVDWYNSPKGWSLKSGEFVVPDGSVYVLGDNREVSEDSRAFGPVEMNRILGKVVIRP